MAKKRKHHKRRRSRRVGALGMRGSDTVIKMAAVVGGFLLGNKINEQIDKMLPKTTDPVPVATKTGKIVATVGEVGIGGYLLLSNRFRGNPGTIAKVVGGVALGAGIKRAFAELGIMTGYQAVPVIGRHRMAGYQKTPVIGGVPAQLSGRTPPQLSGYVNQGSGVGSYVNQGSGVMGSIGNPEGGSGITNTGSGYMG